MSQPLIYQRVRLCANLFGSDLGPNYYDERDREGVKRRAVRRLEQLGYQVALSPSVRVST